LSAARFAPRDVAMRRLSNRHALAGKSWSKRLKSAPDLETTRRIQDCSRPSNDVAPETLRDLRACKSWSMIDTPARAACSAISPRATGAPENAPGPGCAQSAQRVQHD